MTHWSPESWNNTQQPPLAKHTHIPQQEARKSGTTDIGYQVERFFRKNSGGWFETEPGIRQDVQHDKRCVCTPCARSRTFKLSTETDFLKDIAAALVGRQKPCEYCGRQEEDHYVVGFKKSSDRFCYVEGFRHHSGLFRVQDKLAQIPADKYEPARLNNEVTVEKHLDLYRAQVSNGIKEQKMLALEHEHKMLQRKLQSLPKRAENEIERVKMAQVKNHEMLEIARSFHSIGQYAVVTAKKSLITHSNVWHDPFVYVIWLIHLCHMTHSDMCTCILPGRYAVVTCENGARDSLTCVTWPIHLCDMNHLFVRNDSFMCTTWLMDLCDMSHSFLGEVTHWFVRHDSFICVTCQIQTWVLAFAKANIHIW